jgi:glycine/D-amino acid oxidase-like deaminating enzyme
MKIPIAISTAKSLSAGILIAVKRVAIIGTGIAGLGCAHFLHRKFDLTLYEKNDYPAATRTPYRAGRRTAPCRLTPVSWCSTR